MPRAPPPSPACSPPIPPAQVMQDWLAERKLDRKTLDALTRNALQYAQYQEWAAAQGERIF